MLVDVSETALRRRFSLTSATLWMLEVLHPAAALRIGPEQFVAYDRRLRCSPRCCLLVTYSVLGARRTTTWVTPFACACLGMSLL